MSSSLSDTPSTHFDSSWDEGYAPVCSVDRGDGLSGARTGRELETEGGGGPCATRWPAVAEDHLTRLYGNDQCYRIK